ncbi:aminotransferase class I/II-fold pyridoxal phosphate-dependent enzyme [bacterium]|nr:aminotransferase class I/II-fold pyridoxal phosphate-dependent enzyme [bacterium]
MRKAIADAEVGDDVFGEDPTVNHLQERIASLLGKDQALFVPSGTMGNEISLKCHTQPGQEVICEYGCHIYNYESGAASFLSGIQLRPIRGVRGVITAEQVEAVINPPQDHFPQSAVITVENTHNSAGGTIFPLEELERLYSLAQASGLKMHLDGARLWNASIAANVPLSEYAKHCDSISVCFSKGLGAPIGSAIAGSAEFIKEAHRLRKICGGGMRQVGIIAAGALYALEHNIDRLHEDHEKAASLAEELAVIPGIGIDLASVQTNIVVIDIEETGRTAAEIVEKLKEGGVLVVPFGPSLLRVVTHLNVSGDDIKQSIAVFKSIFE